jgi:6-phosphogluconolactonase/glucosamine-6-phosphate isomerase/deaminase
MSKVSHISWSLHNPHNIFTHIEIHFFVRGAKKKARIKQIAGLSRDVNLPYSLSQPFIKMKLIPIITM